MKEKAILTINIERGVGTGDWREAWYPKDSCYPKDSLANIAG
jgi:hypothetical protein